ncbi:MAG TPA: UDP-N-acetylmuramoyl-L-alanine--D-glutamate ligase [Kiritimatiellae bacterium]|nr:UDP-N-acetylmuramoyl-L-alanine--D-glutamate ligase [Kiritimatiellia bacterium]
MVKRALVLGTGRSGRAAARLLASQGWQVVLADEDGRIDALRLERELGEGTQVSAGYQDLPSGPFDLGVISPGFRRSHRWLEDLRRRGIPLVPELELGWGNIRGPVVAVTGSNGKSTAVQWIAAVLREAGRSPRVAGNFEAGPALCEGVLTSPQADPWVIEVSSFQLEHANELRAEAALILDIHPNHLDRHGTMEEYLKVKLRLAGGVAHDGVVVLPESLRSRVRTLYPGRTISFGSDGEPADFIFRDGMVVPRGGQGAVSLAGTQWDDVIRGRGAAAVIALLVEMGIGCEQAADVFRRLPRLPHRGVEVGVFDGIRVIDDSKATSAAAAAAALYSAGRRIRWIAGGRPKQTSFGELRKQVCGRVAAAYFYGEAAGRLERDLAGSVPAHTFMAFADAVAAAWKDARPGETVLLAPACTSLDQFPDFAERGRVFVQQVKRLAKEMRKWETE